MLPTGGDGSAYVKYSNGNVVVGAGSVDRLTVGNGTVTLAGELSASGDLNVGGGQMHDYDFVAYRVRQSSTPIMSSSIFDFSGTAALGNSQRVVFTRVPLAKAGSVLAVSLLTQDCTVKSGSLSGTVLIDGTPNANAWVGMHTGTISTRRLTKDIASFEAGSYLELQLTASSGYLTDTDPTSGSFIAIVTVEY
mgnify:CR=1 FL=1